MAKKKRKTKAKRAKVDRAERVGPTPETVAKLRPWRMQQLLERGPDQGGIDAQAFEAAVDIAESFRLITAVVGFKPLDLGRIGVGNGGMGARGERASRVYIAWGNELKRRLHVRPHIVVEWIEDERALNDAGSINLLNRSLNLWIATVEADGAHRRRFAN